MWADFEQWGTGIHNLNADDWNKVGVNLMSGQQKYIKYYCTRIVKCDEKINAINPFEEQWLMELWFSKSAHKGIN